MSYETRHAFIMLTKLCCHYVAFMHN